MMLQSLEKTTLLLIKTRDIKDDASESRKSNSPLKTINGFPFLKKHTGLCFLLCKSKSLKFLIIPVNLNPNYDINKQVFLVKS